MALGFSAIVTTDGPVYCLEKGQSANCEKAIKNIYLTENRNEVIQIMDKIRNESKQTNQTTEKPVTLKEAFVTDERYVKCQWVNVVNMIFHEFAGINVVYLYSNILF